MSEFVTEVSSQLHQMPHLEHPGLAIASVATAAAIVGVGATINHFSSEKYGAQFSNPQVAKASLDPKKSGGLRRIADIGILTIGLGFAGTVATHPYYEVEAVNTDATTVVVFGGSYGMAQTAFGESTRFNQATDDVKASTYPAKLGVIIFNEEVNSPIEPSLDWQDKYSAVGTPSFDQQNGSEFVRALQTGLSFLPQTRDKDGTLRREGTLLIVSDGIVQDSQAAVDTAAKQAIESGANIQVIVPGTEIDTYTLPNAVESTPAGINSETFSEFGIENVQIANKPEDLQADINKILNQSSTKIEKRPWNIVPLAGGLVAGLALIKLWYSKATRR